MASHLAVHAPYDGSLIAEVPLATPEDVDPAVATAADALQRSPLPRWRRGEILDAAAAHIAANAESFARTIAVEAAKPIRTARVEVTRAIDTFRFSAAVARTRTAEVLPLDAQRSADGKMGFTMHQPIGVVGAITPFNFPLNLVAHKVAPAIAAGCPVVLKPAEQTPLSALALADALIDECGLPKEYLQVLVAEGAAVPEAIVDHPGVPLISFTGSPGVGWAIRGRAPRKRVCLELGNNAPVIVAPDADWVDAAARVVAGGYGFAGQSCVSTQRVYVHESIAKDFVEDVTTRTEKLRTGEPLDEETDVSALIRATEATRISSWIDEATGMGANVVVGGETVSEGVLAPTLVTDIAPTMKLSAEEVFGPVVGIATYRDLDDAIALANDTRYGLQAGIFTSDLETAFRAARELNFGGVLVNEVPTFRADHQPYGGIRESGNTLEGPAYTVQEMTETKTVIIDT